MVQSFFFFHKFFQPSSKLCPSRGQKQVIRWRSFRKYLQGEKVCVVLWKSWSYVQTSHWRPAITSYGYIGKRKPKIFMCLCFYQLISNLRKDHNFLNIFFIHAFFYFILILMNLIFRIRFKITFTFHKLYLLARFSDRDFFSKNEKTINYFSFKSLIASIT